MHPRPLYHPHGPIPGYNPYQAYPDYVPPYDPHRVPGYTQGAWDGTTEDEKQPLGYTSSSTAFAPPPGPPPGLGPNDRDEGFDPAMVRAALAASEADQKPGTGPSSSK